MNRRVATLVGVGLAGVWIGLNLQHNPDPVVHTRTRTVHVPAQVKIVHVTDRPALPQSCLDFVRSMDKAEALGAVITRSSGQHLDNEDAAVEHIAAHSFKQLNADIQRERKYKGITDTGVTDLLALRDIMSLQLDQCQREVK